jgi:FAS-associated factor 2
LIDQITLQLIPRVVPFLEGLRLAATERARERALRDEQDAAFRESVRRDQEKEARRIEEARRAAELEKAEAERRRAFEETLARVADARDRWRLEFRQLLIPADTTSNVDQIRITIRLPDGQRLVPLVARTSTVTSLYCYVDAHLTHTDLTQTDTKTLASMAEKNLQELIQSSGQVAEDWWGFGLFTAYPRQAIPWKPGVSLVDIEGLCNGGQIVVETRGESEHSDDGYDTEKSE